MKMLLAALSVFLLAACDGGDSPTPSSSSSSSTTFDRQAEERAVIDAYLAQLDAFYAAANPPNPDHPALAETATGPLLDSLRANLADLRDRGIGIRKGEQTTNNPNVTRLAATAAVIEDCGVDADVQFRLDTGETVDDSVVSGRSVAKLIKRDGRWLVSEVSFTEQSCD